LTNLGLQNYNSNFLLHLLVIVVVFRCHSSSCDVYIIIVHWWASSCIDISSSRVVIVYRYHLCTSCRALRHLLTPTSTSHFLVRYCTSSSLYLAVVHCRRQVTKQIIVFWVNA